MANLNKVFLMGNITRDLELKYLLNNTAAQDGAKRSKLKVIVENFQFLNRGQPGGYGAPGADPAEYGAESQPAPRQPYRPQQGRPAAQPRPVGAAPAPAAGYDPAADVPSVPADDNPQIKDEEIPF
jgi:single-stranded DNA-binding protein